MKKIKLLITFIIFLLFGNVLFADDRISLTTSIYKASTLVQRGDVRIYSVSFVPTANNGYFILLDAVSDTTSSNINDVKAEGQEATSGNSQFQDFTKQPLEFSTGLYVVINNGYLIVRYE